MVVEKVFETLNQKNDTGLVCFLNDQNELFISVGKRIGFSDDGKPIFEGYTTLDLDDAKALLREMNILVKQLNNIINPF